MTTPAEVRKVLRALPDLREAGFEVGAPLKPSTQFVQQVAAARTWLTTGRGRSRAIAKCSSYGIKHLAENALGGYIPHAAVIVAGVLVGLKPVRGWMDGQNCVFRR